MEKESFETMTLKDEQDLYPEWNVAKMSCLNLMMSTRGRGKFSKNSTTVSLV